MDAEKDRLERENETLRGEIARWGEVVDSLMSSVWLLDADMRVTFASQATQTVLGVPAESVLHRPCWEVVHGTSAPIQGCPVVQASKSRRRETCVWRMGERWIEVKGIPRLDDDGRLVGMVHVADDVTDREHSAAETRSLLKVTRTVVEEAEFLALAREILEQCRHVIGATAGYVALRGADGESEQIVIAMRSDGTMAEEGSFSLALSGLRREMYETEQAVACNDFATSGRRGAVPAGHPQLENVLFSQVRSGEETIGMLALGDKSGGFDDKDARLAEAFGELLAIALLRGRAKARLVESETRYRLLAENVSDVIWVTDLDLRFTYVSPSHERMSGYSVAESLGRRAGEILTQDSARTVAEVLAEELQLEASGGADPKRTRRMELAQTNKDGRVIWTEVNASFLRDAEGRPSGIMGVSREVTEKRRMQASLAQADRLASMGMLAAGVAHEINNPLSYVLYNIESLLLDVPRIAETMSRLRAALPDRFSDEEISAMTEDREGLFQPVMFSDVVERLREALSGADRVKSIVRGLGTFSRVEHTDVGPVDIRPSIEHAMSMARNEIRYRARLTASFGPTPQVLASDGKLAQIVLNLLVNAAQAIDEGDVNGNEITVRTWSDEDSVFIEVSDTGKGIPEELLERIFEPLFTTKPTGVGSGLGLSICRNIVREFHGDISVQSVVGSGSRFLVRLPALREEREPFSAKGAKASSTPPVARARILVVDDEAGIRKLLARTLGRKHDVVTAASGAEAQEILLKDQAFDLLLFDVMMPSIAGMDLHAWLAARNQALAAKVVFVTGGAFTPRAAEYLATVDNVRIDKPFEIGSLIKVLDGILKTTKGGADER